MIPKLLTVRRALDGIRGAGTRRSVPRIVAARVPGVAAAAIALAFLAVLAPAAFAQVTVNPWGPPDVQPFDPAHPPPGLGGEGADASPTVDWSASGTTSYWDPETNTYTVESLGEITISGHTTIRVPEGAPPELLEHENGHDRLSKHEYDQRAKAKMEDAMRGFVGMKFVGEGSTDADRMANARSKAQAEMKKRGDRAKAAIQKQMDVLNGKYDKLTKHGTSGTTADGEAKAKEEQAKAPPAGNAPSKADDSKEHGRADNQQRSYFDGPSQGLAIIGPGLINSAMHPYDPIIGRGKVLVDSLVLVGLQASGGVLLSDTRLQIVDAATQDTLLDGFVFQVASIPSTLPGYAGMIQAYLDIPPASVGGIKNTIGSPFLNGMQAASDAGQLTRVWFYAAAPLFDGSGACVIPPGGVPVSTVVGVAEPPPVPGLSRWGPGALAVLLAGAAAAAIRRRRSIRPTGS